MFWQSKERRVGQHEFKLETTFILVFIYTRIQYTLFTLELMAIQLDSALFGVCI